MTKRISAVVLTLGLALGTITGCTKDGVMAPVDEGGA